MMRIIPAIDLIDGFCVRLVRGDYDQRKTYDTDPLEWAKELEGLGITHLHVVDLDGAKANQPRNLGVLEKIAHATSLDIEWGGGIKTEQSLRSVFSAGARRAICGSVAVDHHETFIDWLSLFGPEHIILGADVRDGMVSTHGWLDTSDVHVNEIIRQFLPHGLTQVICTDISRDGMLLGPNFALYESLMKAFPEVLFTLSGGVSSIDDVRKAADMGLHATIIGKALYEGRIKPEELIW
ncbi:MAG: 1-(5-phosphoribosyl)-5-[(5-phosphoribosylamino)methylideneamino]imidazole-4-carboxamide isomerase [Bacteroidaceae bacterium]|nr:1-(5-phosphoribosyl)-5-[(5-phosphoribosylamino)methylideneamino]imidazole-4-carboxamide isomerase [Bacteroidaceae bacterium]